jgi:protein-S-isoprenylcysteine O-methyltransferase Ste14
MGTAPQPQRKVSYVLQDIVANIQQTIRLEVVLAKVEVKEKAEKASKPAAILATGAILGLFGLGFLLLAVVYGLSLVVAPWLAALIVGGVLVIAGGILVANSRTALKQIDPVPTKTLRAVKENVQWAKDRIK